MLLLYSKPHARKTAMPSGQKRVRHPEVEVRGIGRDLVTGRAAISPASSCRSGSAAVLGCHFAGAVDEPPGRIGKDGRRTSAVCRAKEIRRCVGFLHGGVPIRDAGRPYRWQARTAAVAPRVKPVEQLSHPCRARPIFLARHAWRAVGLHVRLAVALERGAERTKTGFNSAERVTKTAASITPHCEKALKAYRSRSNV